MNETVRAKTATPTVGHWTGRQLDVMRKTLAPDATDSEFEQFLQYAIAKGLDPFVGDVILVIYSKKNADKRKPTIIVTQSGCRKLAARCGDYRPSEDEPTYTYNESLKGPLNKYGIEKCSVTLWKQDKQGAWHKVNGVAYWDEFAAVKEQWGEDETGKRRPTGKQTLEGNWFKMGRLMIAKCATMQALRAGWPETFSGVYSEEEMERETVLDLSATELIEFDQQERRQQAIAMAKNEIAFVDDQGNLTYVTAGQFPDHILALAKSYTDKAALESMTVRNREGMKRFWADHKSDALELKQEIERIAKRLAPAEQKERAPA